MTRNNAYKLRSKLFMSQTSVETNTVQHTITRMSALSGKSTSVLFGKKRTNHFIG
jgi:hypothetical protein